MSTITSQLAELALHLRGGEWDLRAPQELADMIAERIEAIVLAYRATAPAGQYHSSPQKGTPGHCHNAQVWDADGNSVAVLDSTADPAVASERAKVMAQALSGATAPAAEPFPKCTYVLAGKGRPYPRSCQECALGPCKRGHNAGDFPDRVAAAQKPATAQDHRSSPPEHSDQINPNAVPGVSQAEPLPDDVLEALELDPEKFRTEGGAINKGKLRAAILHPYNYLPEDHWLQARFSKPGGRPSQAEPLQAERSKKGELDRLSWLCEFRNLLSEHYEAGRTSPSKERAYAAIMAHVDTLALERAAEGWKPRAHIALQAELPAVPHVGDTRFEGWLSKSERRAITFGDIVHQQILAMRAAVVAWQRESPQAGMCWIANTLEGPGHLPSEEDIALGAQALFDKETAEHEAFRAAHPALAVRPRP